jgi:hypothetical protein
MLVQEAIQTHGVEIFDYLARDAEIPLVTKAACQGDVSLLRVTTKAAATPIPKAGVPVVRGESGGNTHSLHGEGFFDFTDGGRGSLKIGTLTVPEGSEVVLGHPEHGFLSITPGTYQVGRQREFAGEWALVAD